jgi:hypothetical protein
MPTIDEDMSQFERDIRQLKIEYEQYFGGGRAKPPTEIEWRIDTLLKRYSDRGAAMNYSQRFHYSNLVQTYVKYREMFRKRLKQKEEGTVQRHFGAAAKEIERQRARKSTAEGSSDEVVQLPFVISCNDPDHEEKKVARLYAAFRSAKEQAGESMEKDTLEAFQRFVRHKTDQLKEQQNAHEVEYIVTIDNKRAMLKARVKS